MKPNQSSRLGRQCLFFTTLLSVSLLAAKQSSAQVSITPLGGFGGADGWLTPGEGGYTYLGTSSLEPGMAYGNNHLYLVSRNGGDNIRILDKLTGADLGALPLGSGIVSGGTFTVNTVGVGQDGAIYVANLCTPVNGSTPFKIYRWADESSTPTVAFSSTSITAGQLGTDLDVIGGGAATRLIAGEYTGGGSGSRNSFALLATSDGLSFNGSLAPFVATQPTAGDFALGLTFLDSTRVFGAKKSVALNDPVRYVSITAPLATITGQWDFDAGDLSATIGNPLQYRGTTAGLTQFGTTTSFSIADIGGQAANVMRFPACSSSQGYLVQHGGSPNASPSGTKVNQYTVILDILYPSTSTGFRSLWQTETNNPLTTDGDFFVNGANGIGISGQYQGNLTPNVWHRVAFTVDLTTREMGKYIDGINVLTGPVGVAPLGSKPMQYLPTAEAVADGRWALGPLAMLFADQDNETGVGYVNSIQFQDRVLSAAEIAALGGPSASGIPNATPATPAGIGKILATPVLATSSDAPMDYAVVNGLPVLATVSLTDSRVRVYDASNPANLLLLATSSATLANLNSSDAGAVAWGDQVDNGDGTHTAYLYAMNANNGIQAFTVTVGPCTPATLTLFSVTGGGTQCGGATVGLSGSQTGVAYLLQTNSVYAGISVDGTGSAISFGNQPVTASYAVLASNTTYGCTKLMSGSASVTVIIPPAITSGSNPATFTNYQGGYLSFSVTATGSPLNYQWRRDGTNLTNGGRISGATSPTLTIFPADPADSVGVGHGYACMVSNGCVVFSAESTATIIPFVAVPETVTGVWTNRYNGPTTSADTVAGMAIDGDGNVIVTGYSNDGITASDIITVKYSGAGAPLWTNRYNGPANRDDKAVALALDGSGNVMVTSSSHNGNNDDCYTAKYAAGDGSLLWERRYNGPANRRDIPTGLAVDSNGNAIVTGSSENAVTDDYYTVKYAAADGALVWEVRYNGPANSTDTPKAVGLDTGGNVVVTGYSRNLAGNDDYYTAKYAAADGALLWEQRYNGPANGMDKANAITVDGIGNVIVTGQSPNGSNDDIYTVKYAAADGSLVWERRYASAGPFSGSDQGLAIAVDANGNVVVAGYSAGASTLADFYTAKYAAADGLLIWEHTYNGPFNHVDFANDVVVDGNGDVIVVGKSGNGGTSGTGAAWDNIYTAKYAATDGALLWEKIYDGPANGADVGISVAVDGSGNVTIAGYSSYDGIKSDYYTARYAAADGTLIWEQRLDRPGNDSDIAFAVAVDASGNAAVTGHSAVSGFRTWRTVKYGADGALLWVAFNTNSSSEGKAIAMDQSGNIIVSGTVRNGFSDDYYTAKYAAADGALLWARQYNGPADRRDLPTALAVDGNGNVIVTGSSENALWEDYYTAKYAAVDGALIWEVRYNSPANFTDIPRAIGLDASGNVFVTGESDLDYYTAKYTAADGSLLWEKRYNPSGGSSQAWALAVDSNDDVVVTGGSDSQYCTLKYATTDGGLLWEKRSVVGAGGRANSVAVDGGGNVVVTGLVTDNFSTYDFYTAKYAAAEGTMLWQKRGVSAGSSGQAPVVATDASGHVVLFGNSHNGINYDYYTTMLAGENGAELWSARYNGPANGDDRPATLSPLAIGPSGEVIVAGWSDGDYTTGVNPDYVTIKYTFGNGNPNTRPTVANPIPDTNGVYGNPVSFEFAADTFTDPDAGQTLSYAASGLPAGISFTPATRTFSGTPTTVGTNSVTVTATDNGLPALSTNDVFDIVISKASLTATAGNQSRTYAETNAPLTFSYSSFVLGENSSVLDTPPVASTPATNGSAVGSYPITVGGGADDHYEFSYVSGTLSVTPSPLSVTADNTNRTYGASNPSFTGTLVGVANGDNFTAVFSSLAETNSTPGTYPITPALVDPDTKLGNYTVTTNPGTLTITAAPLTITANDTNRVYGTANPDFTGSLVGVVNGDNITATFITAATITDPPGAYAITPMFSDPDSKLPNYSVTTNTGTLTILSPPELSFTLGGSGGELFTLSWPASYAAFVLECTESLTPPIAWQEVTTGITETGGIKSYTVLSEPGVTGRLYRLRLP